MLTVPIEWTDKWPQPWISTKAKLDVRALLELRDLIEEIGRRATTDRSIDFAEDGIMVEGERDQSSELRSSAGRHAGGASRDLRKPDPQGTRRRSRDRKSGDR